MAYRPLQLFVPLGTAESFLIVFPTPTNTTAATLFLVQGLQEVALLPRTLPSRLVHHHRTTTCTIVCALATPWTILSSPSSLSGLNRRGCFWSMKSPFSMFSTFLPLLSSRWEATKGHHSLPSDYTLSPFLVLCETDHASPTFVNFS